MGPKTGTMRRLIIFSFWENTELRECALRAVLGDGDPGAVAPDGYGTELRVRVRQPGLQKKGVFRTFPLPPL